jgi:hypothetical protein
MDGLTTTMVYKGRSEYASARPSKRCGTASALSSWHNLVNPALRVLEFEHSRSVETLEQCSIRKSPALLPPSSAPEANRKSLDSLNSTRQMIIQTPISVSLEGAYSFSLRFSIISRVAVRA